jgi:hypothetical protein
MDRCDNMEFENMLHAYELGILPDSDRERLELHMMNCDSCFNKSVKLKDAARLIKFDKDIKESLHEMADDRGRKQVLFSRILNWLWPESPRFALARPLIIITLAAIIIYPTYRLVVKTGDQKRTVQELYLFPVRGEDQAVLVLKKGGDAEITFVYDSADPDRRYNILIISQEGTIVYSDENYSHFSDSGIGQVILPVDIFSRGYYYLEIRDPSGDSPVDRQVYTFMVE